MKRTSQPRTASLFPGAGACAIALLLTMAASSCIYESPRGDEFYRTLWTSDEVPLDGLTVEFLCGEGASAKAPSAVGSYGTYSFDGPTATFHDLSLRYGDTVIIIEEGYRDGGRMTLTWHYADPQEDGLEKAGLEETGWEETDWEEGRVAEASTTSMYRLSEYP